MSRSALSRVTAAVVAASLGLALTACATQEDLDPSGGAQGGTVNTGGNAGSAGASTSGGTNLGPSSRVLADQIAERAEAILALEGPHVPGLTIREIPVDLLTASASGSTRTSRSPRRCCRRLGSPRCVACRSTVCET